ncbi:hypothetical protein DMH25_02180 [Streptomyces sp. WAC 01325]|uniref:hypothetical protein n=1 Tax=Streptomyces sp. WAC 01325 TaxID=2203202 RepID=UPI00100288A9|nr:hypothetical protein [Streptomyces sp. WAC 01325]RSN17872.1 hypothetical protein DMH25_02180 [Streptomyces sp. WAC 01325]
MTRTERLAAHTDIATSLALLSDRELAALVESGTPLDTGIGGRSAQCRRRAGPGDPAGRRPHHRALRAARRRHAATSPGSSRTRAG